MRRFCGIYGLYVNNGAQKTYFFGFGYWRPGFRISTLRPKKNIQPLRLSVLFLMVRMPRTSLLRSRKEFAYPVRRSTSSLVRRMTRISSKRISPHFDQNKSVKSLDFTRGLALFIFVLEYYLKIKICFDHITDHNGTDYTIINNKSLTQFS